MVEDDTTPGETNQAAPESARNAAARRRRASRAAGPASGVAAEPVGVTVGQRRQQAGCGSPARSARRPAGRPNAMLVAIVGAAVTAVLAIALAIGVAALMNQQRKADAEQAREQQFVDTATQTVVNMFSYNQNNIDDSVNRFVNGTSGPLRDMMSQPGNVDNLKAIFRDTNASSETVINGAALEKVDEVAKNANVLVSVRVTVTDLDGVNKPSQPYRLRVVVHEDDNGHMTGYDLKYPDGGN